ncbi:amino acid adenylation domain-containing protein, partial [Streptomyces sioyaensis]|uniref:amino acid adenylation domain-containing protein n=1 Tax=Streptomyces sioyaensis TaxID=67364 RepID=UPI0037A2CE03
MSENSAYAMPSSFAQQRLWLVQQMAPSSPYYVVPMSLRLRGRLDRGALERALDHLVARHESLRTTFTERDGEILQVIAPHLRVPLDVVDLSALPDAERERHRFVAKEVRRPFDLEAGPLVRQTLLVLGPDTYQLLILSHHIVTDAWSQDIYFRELRSLYESYAAGTTPQLPDVEIQYADYAVWQREQAQEGAYEEDVTYWRTQLAGAGITQLPAGRARPDSSRHHGATHTFELPPELVAALRRLGDQEQATLYMVLLAVFDTVFARSTGDAEVTVAGPIAGRTRPELDHVIGFFVNTLILRTDLSGDPAFRECLRRVRTTCLEAYEHQELPFDRLVEELAPVRDASRNPFFHVMVVLQNAPADDIRLGALELDYELVSNDTAKFDLNVVLVETAEGAVRCGLEYDTALFDAPAMERLGARVLRTATAAATDPDRRLGELPVLGEEERTLLTSWHTTAAAAHDLPETLTGCFERAVALFPDRPAVSDGARTLTYAELDRRANQLAHRLLELGLAPETPVGVCTRRDTDLLVALYGVMKAGCAYLPLDSAYPTDRLSLMLAGSGAAAVVTHDAYRDRLPADGPPVISLDGDALDTLPAGRPDVAVDGGQLCYVIYTSGSTGVPKGVANEHSGLVNLMAWGRELFSDDELAGFSATCSVSFDLSVMELFIPLSFGGTLLIAPNAVELGRLSFPVPVRVLHTVPSIAADLLRSGGLPQGLRTVLLAGEALPADVARGLRAHREGLRVINMYGVTEAACASTSAVPGPDLAGPVPIGAPIRGIRGYVLDSELRPVPVGAPGVLYVGGVGTARAYVGSPGLTAERFVPDPFEAVPGARMYRTGDIVRWNGRGELEYLARGDAQVKLRGVRIEPGELEEAARDCAGVGQAVAVIRQGRRGHAQLVCYVTAAPGGTVDTDAVLAQLTDRLPHHLVPSRVVALERFPLNPNGKVDRTGLAELEPAVPVRGTGEARPAAVPVGDIEARIAAAWCEVLELDRVGRHDNFFDLGGHSLLLLRVRSLLSAQWDAEIPVVEFFRHPTVAALAEHLGARRTAAAPRVPAAAPAPEPAEERGRHIAVVGMQCRVPGARNVEEFWENLLAGRESITTLTPEQLDAAGVSAEQRNHPQYVPRAGLLEGIELFDAAYFGYSPREAELLDPQQRLLLELSVEALQRAGHDPARFPGAIGIYAGVGFGDYLWNNIIPNADSLGHTNGFQVALSVDKDHAASRVAYKLGLRGPAVTVQTACSTSLVAVHL